MHDAPNIGMQIEPKWPQVIIHMSAKLERETEKESGYYILSINKSVLLK